MTITPQITYKNIPASDALTAAIDDRTERLFALCDRISHLRVSIEADHVRHRKGAQYHVHIDLGVPDRELVVSRDTDLNRANEDPYVAVRDSFRAMKRQLRDYVMTRQQFERTGKERRWDGIGAQVFRRNEQRTA